MIRKLLVLKNIIKSSTEIKMLDSLIKEASAEMGSFTTELMNNAEVPISLINALSFKIGTILPGILSEFYPNKSESEINNYVNNNKTLILFEEIELSEDLEQSNKMSILDHYLFKSSEESALPPAINVDAPPAARDSGPLKLMPEGLGEDDFNLEYDEEISEQILRDLLYTFVEQEAPLGDFRHIFDEDEEFHDLDEYGGPDELNEDEVDRFLEFMRSSNKR
jgi:hypothetical protein